MAKRNPSVVSTIFSESAVAVCIAIGVLLVWIATLVGTFGESDNALKAMTVLKNTGVALVSAVLISGGVANAKKERTVRIAMVVMGAIILLVLVATVAVWRPWGF